MKCPACRLDVASHDPERIQKGTEIFHGSCLRKKQTEERTALNCHVGARTPRPATQRVRFH